MSRLRVFLLAAVAAAGVGCGVTSYTTVEGFQKRAPANPSLLVMAPDVELYELTAGGVLEPKADWTEVAEKHVSVALVEELKAKQLNLVSYDPHPEGSKEEHEDLQILKLHFAMMRSIFYHHYVAESRLPAKKGNFDWTMGPGVRRLCGNKKADYILLLLMRDSYSSGGRATLVALTTIFAPLTGGAVSGGEQAGFASLVDASTGEVVWCNLLHRKAGDLRTAESARTAVRYLLEGLPW